LLGNSFCWVDETLLNPEKSGKQKDRKMKNINLLVTVSAVLSLVSVNVYAKNSVPTARYNYQCSHSKDEDTYTLHINPDDTIGYAYIDEDKGKLTGAILKRDGYTAQDPVRFSNESGSDAIELSAVLLTGASKGKIRVVGSYDLEPGVYMCDKE
jgi:hypothetical protein